MAAFQPFDSQSGQPSDLTDAVIVPDSGINVVDGSVTYAGGTIQTF